MTREVLRLFVRGEAQSQGSMQTRGNATVDLVTGAIGVKTWARHKPTLIEWRYAVAVEARRALPRAFVPLPKATAVELRVCFVFSRPPSLRKRMWAKVTAPDLDKLVRAIGDALTEIVWTDDSQIVQIVARKEYGARPGALIVVNEIGAPFAYAVEQTPLFSEELR